ncbi:hypothetical protein ONZ51_g11880 [Trametes cubensis]|uniref:Uncharacterized protein n=1 Tax=Trametes cubensis TaxID=1111947 RepID=A0AAD7X5X1_9APHY|nr:hypothetical protein ONZ51_g11880 [Trametes cubensis]
MFSSTSHIRVGSTSIQEELIPLGHNWFIHNPNHRSVRVRYEHIPAEHHDLAIAEVAMEKIVRVLAQMRGWRASLVPCLHRSELGGGDTLSVVIHATMLHVEVLDMLHLMGSDLPVHLYIGDPLATGTSFDVYSPERLLLPDRLTPGDPIFCSSTERVTILGAYLYSPDGDTIYGLTAGQAVVPHASFQPHPRLLSRTEKHQRQLRSSQLALHCLGKTLSNPAVKIVEHMVRHLEAERAIVCAEKEEMAASRPLSPAGDQRHRALLQQYDSEHAILCDSLNRPHEFDVGHACAAEAIIRPCNSSHGRQPAKSSRKGKQKGEDHTHLLSWALVRMASKTGDNPGMLRANPGTLERGAAVTMHVQDPNLERPVGPFRDGVVNGAPASVVIDGHVAREWAVFPAPDWKGSRFAARGDAGALLTSTSYDDLCGGRTSTPVAMLYAIPERGPYGLVTPLTTIMRRIKDVTGLQLRFQGEWRRGDNG